MKDDVKAIVDECKVIVIVRGVYGDAILGLAKALSEGGIRMMEVTFDQKNRDRWADTCASIALVCEQMGSKMIVGAGTVTTVELVEMAASAGAKFIVSPDCQPNVIRRTVELGMVSMPGGLTATEVSNAYRAGADYVKVFPATQLGPAYIKAIRAPLNHIPLLAVGGVNEKNAADFIKAGCAGIGVGGNLVNKDWIANGEWEKITKLAGEFISAVKGAC